MTIVRNWSFGAKKPIENLELCSEQIYLAHRYKNALVELELERRQAYHDLHALHLPELENLQAWEATLAADVETLRAMIRRNRQIARGRTTAGEMGELLSETRDMLALVRAQRRAAMSSQRGETLQQALLDLEQCAASRDNPGGHGAVCESCMNCRRKILRARSGLWWGCYLAVEDAASKFGEGPPPQFRRGCYADIDGAKRFVGDGKVSVQLQGGLKWTDALLGADNRFRLERMPVRDHPNAPRQPGSRRSERSFPAIAWLRIGSDGRKPVWLKAPVVVHRTPPEGSIIKWVHLCRKRIGTQTEWSLVITLAMPDPGPLRSHGRVAVNPGWRKQPDYHILAATWIGEDGRGGQLFLPPDLVEKQSHAERLQALRDTLFDQIRSRLIGWLAIYQGMHHRPLPDWLVHDTETLASWRSCGRLRNVAEHWRHHRFEHDGEVIGTRDDPGWLEEWREKDKHLCDWMAHEMRKVQDRRRDLYRNLAAQLREHYDEVILGKTGSWRKLARLPDETAEKGPVQEIRQNQRLAAPGFLEEVIANSRMKVIRVDAANATRTCHACGSLENFDAARYVEHTCSKCGRTWDQDINHCLNLLRIASSEVVNESPGISRDPQAHDVSVVMTAPPQSWSGK